MNDRPPIILVAGACLGRLGLRYRDGIATEW
jgi:hypothetical protein